ncbi:L-amino acid N-acyltransferase YncA [Algoriphagus boseongensis]|uniref:L-amino acid N-acyltransferase YncA n=1 Tax=Algoriphagus boseongensis TaxID=1442587 RepID=A0A4R6T898_9BACT|nr:GNAT family N-acetyltransferase [Algoriphagus boseongensis]TDQ19468.1 L-amino acid N-acyltransferase YncA [Algoriphagus boseongensis]
MNSELYFRKATSKDENALWEIIEPVIRNGGTYVFDTESSKEKIMTYWLSHDKETYVAEISAKLIGTFFIKPNQPDLGNHICNAGFIVSQEFLGKGFGRKLGEFAIQEARKLGFQAMQFNYVIETNHNAVKLWQSLGFEIKGKIPEAYRHPELGLVGALIMYQKF